MSDSSGSLRLRIRKHRGTLRLLSHAALAELTPHLADGTGTQAEALVETIQRAWLFAGGAEPFAELPRFRAVWQRCGLSEALIAALDRWLLDQRTERTYDEPVDWGSLAPVGLQRILRKLLHAWSVADGSIVFVRDIDDPDILPATLLPFLIHERPTDDQPLASAQNGEAGSIDLNDSIKSANDHARRKGWIGRTEKPCLELHTLPGATDVKIGGGSGGLPVLIAHRFRHAGLRVPALRLGASGVLDSGGVLSSVTESKQYATKHALFSALGISTVILPEPMLGGWPSGVDITRQLDSLVTEFRQQYGEAVPLQLKCRLIDFRSHLDSKRSLFTGREWLFEKIEFWQHDGEEHVMLLVGDPGLGKSSIIAEFLHRNPEEVVAHHCCVSDENETLRPGRFVQSIAAMLADKIPEYAKQLAMPTVANALSDKRCEDDPAGAFSEGILNPLHNVRPPEDGIRYILVDALDEALCYEGRVNIVELLAGRLERMPTWVRVVATTRNDPYVLKRLSGFRREDLDAAEALNTNDISLFITRRLKRPELAGKLTEHGVSAETVISILTKRSAGNFLYAVHALDDVQFDRDRFDGLGDLPSGLEGLYLRFFERVFGNARSNTFDSQYGHAKTLLEVTLAAHEPLTAAELSVATGLDTEMKLPRLLRQLAQYLPQRLRNDGQKTFAFYHKSFSEWLHSDHDFHISKRTGNRRLADFCIREDSNLNSLSYYARRHAIAHFTETEEWDRAAKWLSDLHFIAARAREGEIFALHEDYARVLQRLPEAQEDNRREHSRREDVERWTREIVQYAAEWSARRREMADGGNCSNDEPLLPKPPHVVARWSEERISAEVNRICRNPTRLDRVRAFSIFVANSDVHLAQFGGLDGFLIQQALNSDPSGLVHEAGKRLLPTLTAHVLLRKWRSSDHYTPCPAFLRLLNGSGPVCITPDGRRALSSDADYNRNLLMWDLETGKCLSNFEGDIDLIIMALSMTPDGRRAITGNNDKTVRVWDLERGTPLAVLHGHTGQVCSVSVTPDGRRAVSTSDDNSLRVWNLERYVCERVFDEWGFYSVNDICISPDGRRAFFGGSLQALHAWNLEEGGFLLTLEDDCAEMKGLDITSDEGRAITADDFGKLLVWDLKTGERWRELQDDHGKFNAVKITANGERAISAGPDRTLVLWNAETGQKLCVLEGHSGEVDWVGMTVDGRRAISAGDDYTLRVWDLEKGGTRSKTKGLHQLLNPIVFAAVGQRGVSGEVNGVLRIWDLEKGTCLVRLKGHSQAVTHISVTADGRIAVSVGKDHFIRAWDLVKREKLNEQDIAFHAYSSGLCVSPDGQFALVADSILFKWHIRTGRIRELQGHSGIVTSVTITPDGRYAVSAGLDNTLRIWDVANEQCLQQITASSVSSMGTTPDGRRVIFVGSDEPFKMEYILTVMDLESGQPLWRRPGAEKAIVTPNGRRVILAGVDETLRVYDLETGASCGEPLLNAGGVQSLSVSPDGRFVIFGSWDRTLRVWDLEELQANLVMGVPALVTSLFIGSQSAHWVAITASDLIFLHPHNFPAPGPLLTTASRVIRSQDAAPGPALARPSCCGVEFKIPASAAQRIDAFGLQAPSTAFSDAALLIRCPHCQTRLRLNPFFLDIGSLA